MRGVVPTELNRLTTRSRQRGFTLIEIAIAMVVIGLLLGATAVTSRHLEEKRQLQREMQQLEIVRDAIVGYAIRNRTRERILKVVPWFGPGEWEFRLPAGRPYLPCPDWDGDGYEDRVPQWAFTQGTETSPDLTVTLTIGAFAPPDDRFLAWTQDSGEAPAAHPYGECRVSRGTVPWRTLGVDPSDGWGNRHTYFADPVFSNIIFGFDRQTVADIYDPRIPSAPGYGAALRHAKVVFSDREDRSILNAPAENHIARSFESVRSCPAAICVGDSACEPAQFHSIHGRAPSCAWRINQSTVAFKAGLVTPVDIPDGRKPFPAGSVVDGLPFVLVAHGANRRYAVNDWRTADLWRRPYVLRGLYGFRYPICNMEGKFGPTRIDYIDLEERALHFEKANAARITSEKFRLNSDACVSIEGGFGGSRVLYNTASFVWHPPGNDDKSDFDDMLVWMTRGELTGAIRGRIPRIPPMIIAYFPP